MRVRSVVLTIAIALLAASTTLPSFAATPAMEACSAKWADLKAKATSKKAPEKGANNSGG
jgi:hypothetical protein